MVGYTASKKVGKAVLRNKAKRRLKNLVLELGSFIPKNYSIVFIANSKTPIIDFSKLRSDISYALKKIISLEENT